MKRSLYCFLLVASAILLFQSCDNGNADVTIFDSPPAIELVKPRNVTSAVAFNLKAKFKDGADPSISSSPLSSASYEIKDVDGDVVSAGDIPVSGVLSDVSVPIEALAAGEYTLILRALDTNSNAAADTSEFTVINSVGIIGDATPGGWGTDTNLTRSASDPDLYTATITLGSGEAKFRANDDWAINWGAATFPSGNGVQDGANIPVTPGTYTVTFNVSTGAYTFE
jgi:hypothetical protein